MAQAIGSLYQVPDRRTRAIETHNAAGQTLARQQPAQTSHTEGPGKTAGGAIMNAAGGVSAGAAIGSALGMTLTGPGALLFAAGGVGSYLFS